MTLSFPGGASRKVRGYSAGGSIAVTQPTAPSAPTVTAAQSGSNGTTHLTIGLTGGMPARGDYIRLQYKLQSSSTWLDGPQSMVAGDFPYELAVLVAESDWDVRAYARNTYGESSASTTAQASTASPPAGNVVAAVTVTGWDQTIASGGTITVPVGAMLHINCAESQSANLGANEVNFIALRAYADFDGMSGGDAWTYAGGGWAYAPANKDEHAGALITARCPEVAGTYSVTGRVTDGTDHDTFSFTVVVQDPATHFTNVVDVAAGAGAWPTWANDTFYRLVAGGDYTAKTGTFAVPNTGKDKIMIGIASPTGSKASVAADFGLTENVSSASFTPTKRVIIQGVTSTGIGRVSCVGSSVTLNRCHAAQGYRIADKVVSNYGTYGGSNFVRPSNIGMHECTGGPKSDGYVIFGSDGAKNVAIVGGYFDIAAEDQHVIRLQCMKNLVMEHFKVSGHPAAASARSPLTVRSKGMAAWTENAADQQNCATEHFVIGHFEVGSSSDAANNWHVFCGPINTSQTNRVEYGVIENGDFNIPLASASQRNLVVGGRYICSRNHSMASSLKANTETYNTAMSAVDFYPNWADAFDNGFLANKRIANPTDFDPSVAG